MRFCCCCGLGIQEAFLEAKDPDETPPKRRSVALARDSWGRLALHWASIRGHPACIRSLVSHAPKVIDSHAKGGETPLMRASLHGHGRSVTTLLELKADVHARDPNNKWTGFLCNYFVGRSDGFLVFPNYLMDAYVLFFSAALRREREPHPSS